MGDAGFLLGIFLLSALLGTIRFHGDRPRARGRHIADGRRRGDGDRAAAFRGRDGKVGADSALRVAAGRDGRPDAGERVDSRGDDGDRGRLHGHADECDFSACAAAMAVVAVVGAVTAIFAATIGVVQNDIKKVLAYSTISQLGYMFLACGVGAFTAGIFHLMTHAFFKGLLFLAAGSVIHAHVGRAGHAARWARWRRKYRRRIGRCWWRRWRLRGFHRSPDSLAKMKFWEGLRAKPGAVDRGLYYSGDDGVLHVPPDVHDIPRRIARGSRG